MYKSAADDSIIKGGCLLKWSNPVWMVWEGYNREICFM